MMRGHICWILLLWIFSTLISIVSVVADAGISHNSGLSNAFLTNVLRGINDHENIQDHQSVGTCAISYPIDGNTLDVNRDHGSRSLASRILQSYCKSTPLAGLSDTSMTRDAYEINQIFSVESNAIPSVSITELSALHLYEPSADSSNIPVSRISRFVSRHRTTCKRLMSISGGETKSFENAEPSSVQVLVSTSVGSTFLDKKKKFVLSGNATIQDLKEQIHQKFPGSPPPALQRLFFGVRQVENHEMIRNISAMPIVPILLDMITGTSVYGKTLSVSQTIEAYVSTIVQQTYICDNLRTCFDDDSLNSSAILNQPETSYYREMFNKLNESIHEKYHEDIKLALEEESEPETVSADTIAWRGKTTTRSPLSKLLAKEFDLNLRGLRNFFYYSGLLGFFAWYGTSGEISAKFLISMIPVLWISKLRHLRVMSKLFLYFSLPIISNMDFVMPLLSAPLQVLASESAAWSEGQVPTKKSKKVYKPQVTEERSTEATDEDTNDNDDYEDDDYLDDDDDEDFEDLDDDMVD